MKKKYSKIQLLGLVMLLALSACQDWLDVRPKTEIESKNLFEEESGFKEALAGVYTGLTDPHLYGRDLTYGVLDVMGQYWKVLSPTNEFFHFASYQFEDRSAQGRIDEIWAKMYNVIANVNNILENIDARRNLFYKDNYSIIKGEALALRAYAHFDLLRMFAPADFTTETGYMPYVKEFSKKVVPFSSPKEIAGQILADLTEAEKLLQDTDPLVTGEKITVEDDHGYLLNRQFHLNYYAVCGLAARVNLYVGQKDAARTEALKVVEAQETQGVFPWVRQDDITVDDKEIRDKLFSSELLFALNIRKLSHYIEPYFMSSSANLVTQTKLSVLYEGMADYRSDYLFDVVGTQNDICIKLWQGKKSDGNVLKRNTMPMLRMSELYYILAETEKADHVKAVEYLNQVRRHRGIAADLDASQLAADELQYEIQKEYQKEFICEGQLWFYHKRRHDETIANMKVNYVFPAPMDEKEYGNRPK